MRTDDASLRALYATLMAKRRPAAPPSVTVEQVHSLATGVAVAGDREALLDQVLSHPDTARELQFFMDLPRESPARRVWFRSPGTLALAAGLLLAVGFGLRQLTTPRAADVMRSDAAEVTLRAPSGDTIAGGSVKFVWDAISGASSYALEVTRDDGTLVASATTSDTTATATVSAGALRWWVTATLDDGTTRRSAPRPLPVR